MRHVTRNQASGGKLTWCGNKSGGCSVCIHEYPPTTQKGCPRKRVALRLFGYRTGEFRAKRAKKPIWVLTARQKVLYVDYRQGLEKLKHSQRGRFPENGSTSGQWRGV